MQKGKATNIRIRYITASCGKLRRKCTSNICLHTTAHNRDRNGSKLLIDDLTWSSGHWPSDPTQSSHRTFRNQTPCKEEFQTTVRWITLCTSRLQNIR